MCYTNTRMQIQDYINKKVGWGAVSPKSIINEYVLLNAKYTVQPALGRNNASTDPSVRLSRFQLFVTYQ